MILLILLLTSQYDKALTTEVQEKQRTFALSTATNMDRWLNLKISPIEESIKSQKNLYFSGDISRIIPTIKQLKTTDPENISFAYISPDGIGYGSDGVNNDFNTMEHPGVGKISKFYASLKKPTVQDVIGNEAENMFLPLFVPLLDNNGGYQGGVASVVKVDVILNDINAIKLGTSGYAYLISDNGTIMAHPDKTRIGKSFKEFADGATTELFNQTVLAQHEPQGELLRQCLH
jgi:hypothetical protein